MEKQLIDAAGITTAYGAICTANNNINNAFFNPLTQQMLQLRSNWHGKAGEATFNRIDILINGRNVSQPSAFQRFDELQDVVKFLSEQVIPGYFNTETVNTSLADQFT